MCKEMMKQRAGIEEELRSELEKCLEGIRQRGEFKLPSLMVDLESIFIANREYFEHQGFYFEPETKRVLEPDTKRALCDKFKYFAWIRLGGGEGELAKDFWNKIREAQTFFKNAQRKKISERLKNSRGASISVDMNGLLFENKVYFEELGYVFEPDIRRENGIILCYAWMKKKY